MTDPNSRNELDSAIIDHLRKVNEDLVKQSHWRWSVFMSTIVLLLTFGTYVGIQKIEDTKELSRRLDKQLEKNDKTSAGSVAMLNAISRSSVLLNNAYRDHIRKNYNGAFLHAKKASELLDSHLTIFKAEEIEANASQIGQGVSPFIEPLEIALRSSLDMQARGAYFRKSDPDVKEAVRMLQELNTKKDSSEYHHWAGMSETKDNKTSEKAVEHFTKSIELNPMDPVDYANLVEIHFIRGELNDSIVRAEQVWKLSEEKKTPITIVVLPYWWMSKYIRGDEETPAKFEDFFKEKTADKTVVLAGLSGTFDTDTAEELLRRLVSRDKPFQKVTGDQDKNLKFALEALVGSIR